MRSVRPGPPPEDAPAAPLRRPTTPPTLPAELPLDPTAVNFDFEPEDLPVEAIELLGLCDVTDLADISPGGEALIEGSTPELVEVEAFALFGDDEGHSLEGARPLQAQPDADEEPYDEGAEPTPLLSDRRDIVERRLAGIPGPQRSENAAPSTPTAGTTGPRTAPQARATAAPSLAPAPARPRSKSPLWRVPFVFAASMVATTALALLPWFIVLSPRLHEVQAAQRAERQAAATRVAEIPTPVPVTVERVAATVPEPTEEAETEEVEEAIRQREFALAAAPAPKRRVWRAARPPSPTPRAEPEPDPRAEPEPDAATSRAEPPPPPPEPTPVPARAAAEARALNGRYGGTSKGEPVLFDLEFLANGSLRATIQRGSGAAMKAMGRYALAGERATIALVEPTEGGASYSATVSVKSVSGRISYPSGKNHRFSLGR